MSESIVEITLPPAKLFRLYIKGSGISYKWIAAYTDISPTYISLICNEKVPLPNKIREKLNELLETDY